MSNEDLKKELLEIENKLADPEFVLDYKRVAEASKRYSDIQKMIESGNTSSGFTQAIVEIRPGAGGDEASLFAQTLYEMYKKYAELKNWQFIVLEHSTTEVGGTKLAIFELRGVGSYDTMQYESGVHRVQRIPSTEKSDRVHTSTATVATLPKVKETDVDLKSEDMEISFYRSGGPGGQNVNKVSTAVRIVHMPTGITVSSQKERNQARNKEIALEILRSKIFDIKQKENIGKVSQQRKAQVGTGDRSEKIRTYNYPQDRITDHRIKKSWGNIERILAGELDPIMNSLKEFMQNV